VTDAPGSSPGDTAGATVLAVDTGRFLWAVFLGCLIVEIALVYLDLTVNWLKWSDSGAIRRLFNTTREDGLASWFAVSQTLLAALAAWLIVVVLHHQRTAAARRLGWLVIAVFFSWMCIDDGAAVHERLGTAFEDSAGIGGFPSYAWQYLLLPFFGLMGVFTLCFLWREMPRASDRLRLCAAIGCFVVAVGMDFVEGLENGYAWLTTATGWEVDATRHFSKSLEELVEMIGMSLFLVAFIAQLARTAPRLDLRFVAGAGSAAAQASRPRRR